jgi:hypothetical protein
MPDLQPKRPWGDGSPLVPVPMLYTAGALEDALLTLAKAQREYEASTGPSYKAIDQGQAHVGGES